MIGNVVTTPMSESQTIGCNSISWNATNDYGRPVSAGIYLYQIKAGRDSQTMKIILLK
jgi:flagellar hook assembly protein FlgD